MKKDIEISEFNCFNKLWIKRYECVYFYKIENDF